MLSQKVLSHDKRISDVAEEYKQRGYKVIVAPSSKELPEFLSKFRPDIVAESPDESVVIELKSMSKERSSKYWSALASEVQKHPGWRFELIVGDTEKRELPKTITREQINKLLLEGQHLAQERKLNAALLITWSAVEAAMRYASKSYDIDLPDFRPTTLIGRLYQDGVVGREDYNFLLECMRIRNAVAHGFRGETPKAEFVRRLRQLALRLLDNSSSALDKAS